MLRTSVSTLPSLWHPKLQTPLFLWLPASLRKLRPLCEDISQHLDLLMFHSLLYLLRTFKRIKLVKLIHSYHTIFIFLFRFTHLCRKSPFIQVHRFLHVTHHRRLALAPRHSLISCYVQHQSGKECRLIIWFNSNHQTLQFQANQRATDQPSRSDVHSRGEPDLDLWSQNSDIWSLIFAETSPRVFSHRALIAFFNLALSLNSTASVRDFLKIIFHDFATT